MKKDDNRLLEYAETKKLEVILHKIEKSKQYFQGVNKNDP